MSTLLMQRNDRYAFVRSRGTSYRFAVPAAILLLLGGLIFVPVRWIESLVPPLPSVGPFESNAYRPGEIRIISVQVESPTPSPAPAVEVTPKAKTSPAEPASKVKERARWTFDPTSAYRYGDEILARQVPSLADEILAKQADASPVLAMLHPDLSSTWDEKAHAGFEKGHDIHRWGLAQEWDDEMRRRRMDAYWEKYVLAEGEP
jgi:hypothetical protein